MQNVRGLLYVFQGAALLVLLVAVANVANLLLALALTRMDPPVLTRSDPAG